MTLRETLRRDVDPFAQHDSSVPGPCDEIVDDVLRHVAESLRKEHANFRGYQPLSLVEWLERQ